MTIGDVIGLLNVANLFVDDIGKNCIAALTHTDSDRKITDAVQLIKAIDIFGKKNKNEKWYFVLKLYRSSFFKDKQNKSM